VSYYTSSAEYGDTTRSARRTYRAVKRFLLKGFWFVCRWSPVPPSAGTSEISERINTTPCVKVFGCDSLGQDANFILFLCVLAVMEILRDYCSKPAGWVRARGSYPHSEFWDRMGIVNVGPWANVGAHLTIFPFLLAFDRRAMGFIRMRRYSKDNKRRTAAAEVREACYAAVVETNGGHG
jgi:hypothetical protein